MQVAIRSYLIAGVSAAAVSALVLSPVSAPSEIQVPALRAPAVVNTAFTNPFTAFAPVFLNASANTEQIIEGLIADPLPIVRQVFTNQVGDGFTIGNALGGAGVILGSGAFNYPNVLVTATQELLAGDPAAALQTLTLGTLGPVLAAGNTVAGAFQTVIQRQLAVASALVNTLPSAGLLVVGTTISAITQITTQAINSGLAVAASFASFNPETIWNTSVAAGVTLGNTIVNTTIGNGTSVQTPSIKIGVAIAQAQIVDALQAEPAPVQQNLRQSNVESAAPLAVAEDPAPAVEPKAKREGPITKVVNSFDASKDKSTPAAGDDSSGATKARSNPVKNAIDGTVKAVTKALGLDKVKDAPAATSGDDSDD